MQVAANYLLFLFACVWPWDVFSYIPFLGVDLLWLIALVLIGLWIFDVVSSREVGIPFEIAWPVALLLLVVWFLPSDTGSLSVSSRIVVILFFVATTHFAPAARSYPGESAVIGGSRPFPGGWLMASALSGGAVGAVSLICFLGKRVPTAYSLETSATLTFARDLPGGVLTLSVCFAIAFCAALRKADARYRRIIAMMCCLLALSCAVMVACLSVGQRWHAPGYGYLVGWEVAGLVVVLWLLARITAKVEVARRRCRVEPALSSPSDNHIYVLLLLILLVGTCVHLLFAVHVRLWHAFMAGLACAYALPPRGPEVSRRAPRAGLVLAGALVWTNMTHVYLENPLDPRNYDAAAQSDLEAGRFDDLERRMAFFEEYSPNERRTHLWRARAELEQKRPHRAAIAFAKSLAPPVNSGLILPAPNELERGDFQVRLRDLCSSLPNPESSMAYEMGLVALGDGPSAIGALKNLVGSPRSRSALNELAQEAALRMSSESLVRTITFLLRDPRLEHELGQWPAEDLVTLLIRWGARVEYAPRGFPRERLPLVIVSQYGPGEYGVSLEAANVHWQERGLDSSSVHQTGSDWGAGGWTMSARDSMDEWLVGLVPAGALEGPSLLEIGFAPGELPTIIYRSRINNVVADQPVIGVWLAPPAS